MAQPAVRLLPGGMVPGTGLAGRRLVAGLLVGVGILLVTMVLSIALGARVVPLGSVLDAFVAFQPHADDHIVVRELRLPRTLVGLAVGTALGVAGVLMQALTRNPLAEPGILGVNQGAAFGLVVAVAGFGVTSPWGFIWFTFAGAALATGAVYAVVARGKEGASPVRLILAGVAVTYVLSGLIHAVVLSSTSTFDRYRSWILGSLADTEVTELVALAPFLAVGGLVAVGLVRALNALALGDETARALGVRRGWVRIGGAVAVTLLCGTATALAGPIVFLGLVVPYIARLLTGPDYRWLLPYSAVLAPAMLLAADVLGRLIARPMEISVGLVVAFVGAPVLIVLVRRRGRLPRL